MTCEWHDKIFSVSEAGFQALALEIFHFQYQNNRVYRAFTEALMINPSVINSIEKIPFLPISFFKSHEIKTGEFYPKMIFESSGTTGSATSRHFVKDTGIYTESFTRAFEKNYGAINEFCIIGLLPSYLERKTSSLVFMVHELIKRSGHPQSGFYLDEFEKLKNVLEELETKKQKTILLGVTFALLDFAETFPIPLHSTIVMETGGMKGRREEMTSTEVHEILKKKFCKNEIHSEYGMTELLSQAYSKGNGLFHCPPWMKVLVRVDEDPFLIKSAGSGTINIIDLANIWSCSFIATDDVGKLNADARPDDSVGRGSFEVLGRMDNSDLRGCSLMVV
jgi:phenylacetate-coenzyme A ligase PaaK-like adenylate-forming protein